MSELLVNSFLYWHKAYGYAVAEQDDGRKSESSLSYHLPPGCVINYYDFTKESAFDFWIIEFF